jgi:hypothetical protein
VIVLVNENSPILDIALEANDVTDDVKQSQLAIETSVKHVDNTVDGIKLSEVPEFIDNYPISKPEIKDGYVGYAVDNEGGKYDVTVIGNMYYNNYKDFSGNVTQTTNFVNNTIFVLHNGNFVSINVHNELVLHSSIGTVINKIEFSSSMYKWNKIEVDGIEYVAVSISDDKAKRVDLYSTEDLTIIMSYDSSFALAYHIRYESSGGLFFIISNSGGTSVSVYDFYTGEHLSNITLATSNISTAYAFADSNYIYMLNNQCYVSYVDRSTYTVIESKQMKGGQLRTACYFGDKKIFCADISGVGIVYDLVTKTASPSQNYSSSSSLTCMSDGFCAVILVDNQFYKIDESGTRIYTNTSPQGSMSSSYSYPYWYQYRNNYFYKFKDLNDIKLIAKAKKRG